MERLQQYFKIGAGVAIALAVQFSSSWLGEIVGASPWLTSVVTLTIFLLIVGAWSYRDIDEIRKKGLLLMLIGLFILSMAGFVNEYIEHFFSPTMLHSILAFLPTILFFVYHAWSEKRAFNASSVNNRHDGEVN